MSAQIMKVDLNKSCNLCVWEKDFCSTSVFHPSVLLTALFFYCVVESYHLRMWDFLIKNKKNQQKHTNNKCLMKQDFKCTFSWTDRNSNQLSFFFRLMFLCSFVQSVFYFFCFSVHCRVTWMCYMLCSIWVLTWF